jgi:hypothetical protein
MEPEGSLLHYQEPSTGPPILSQMDPVHKTPSCFSKIHFNIVLPHKSRPS